MASPLYGPMHLQTPTGVGGFEVSYAPAAQVELVRIGGGVEFKDGIRQDGIWLRTEIRKLQEQVDYFNQMPQTQRQNSLRPYQWTDGDKADWLKRLEAAVEGFWSGQFQFHVNQSGWETLGATTALDVDVREGAKQGDDHLALQVYKVPDDLSAGIGAVRPGRTPHDNRMTLASSDVAPRNDNLLETKVPFPPGRNNPEAPDVLDVLAARFKAGADTPPDMTWQVQGTGKDAEAQARRRFEAIQRHMVAKGFARERLRFEFGGEGDVAHAIVGNGRAQNVAVHEFGHALGLKDEYAQDPGGQVHGSGKPAGTPSGHDALARKVGLPGSVHQNDDGLMSFGNLMRPQYAAPFLWALRQVTRLPQWADGPAKPRQ